MRACVKSLDNSLLSYKGIIVNYSWSEEDSCWHGKLVGIRDLYTFEGDFFMSSNKLFADTVVECLEENNNDQ